MFLHFSTLLGLTAFPLLGFIVPVVLWQVQKDEFPVLDAHGRSVVNWMISSLIYFAISFVLVFFVVGVPLLILLYILNIVFPLIGGLKAQKGELWEYPLTMRFI